MFLGGPYRQKIDAMAAKTKGYLVGGVFVNVPLTDTKFYGVAEERESSAPPTLRAAVADPVCVRSAAAEQGSPKVADLPEFAFFSFVLVKFCLHFALHGSGAVGICLHFALHIGADVTVCIELLH
jgi:hypothetical protein